MSTSSVPLWGIAYELILSIGGNGSSTTDATITCNTWEPEALRIKFEVLESSISSPFWFADISVYNVNDADVLALLNSASGGQTLWLTLKAGFQAGNNLYSTIWSGPVLQVMYDQEQVVDRILRFNCVQSANQTFSQIFFNFQAGGMLNSQYQMIEKMITQGGGSAGEQVSQLAQTVLSKKQYPRGKTFFGGISKYMQQMADDNGLMNWKKNNQNYISELADPNAPPAVELVYGPAQPPGSSSTPDASVNYSIVGVPRQTPMGCIFTVLLDPRLSVKLPPIAVKIQGLLAQYKLVYGQNLPTQWDTSGVYLVAQVRHYGDSRGNDWCTEVTGYQLNYAYNLLNHLDAMAE